MTRFRMKLSITVNIAKLIIPVALMLLSACAEDEKTVIAKPAVGGVDLTGTYKTTGIKCYNRDTHILKDAAVSTYNEIYEIKGNELKISYNTPGCQAIAKGTIAFTNIHRLYFDYTVTEATSGSCVQSQALNSIPTHNITPTNSSRALAIGDNFKFGKNDTGLWVRNVAAKTVGILYEYKTSNDNRSYCVLELLLQ